MESYSQYHIAEFWLQLPVHYKTKLAFVRTKNHLKACIDNDILWVRGLTQNDLASAEIRSIPFKQFYYQRENALFKVGGNLPEYRLKSSWLWTSLEHLLIAELPDYNFNLFETNQNIDITVVPSTVEQQPTAQYIDWVIFENYITSAPSVRLKPLKWVIIGESVLIVGKPLLSLPGQTFWYSNDFFIPTGFQFEYEQFAKIFKKRLNSEGTHFVIFNSDSSYFKIEKNSFEQLSISSFRKTKQL